MPKGFYGTGRNWTPGQIDGLIELLALGLSDAEIGRRLGRSAIAVKLKQKRSGLPSRLRLLLTARSVGRMMGLPCSKTVAWWIRQGYLQCMRPTEQMRNRAEKSWRHRRQFRRPWYVSLEAVYDFVADPRYRHLWDEARIVDSGLRAHARDSAPERYLTTGQVGQRYFVSHEAVWQWIDKGYLPGVRRGNWLVPESALRGFVPPGERSRLGRHRSNFTNAEDVRLCMLRARGRSYAEIAEALGRDSGSVSGRLRRLSRRNGRVEVAA
jgi:hypothetical protein